MASKKTVTLDNLDNLAGLGPERLAAILVDLARGNAEVKRRLRLELTAEAGGDIIAAEIGKRLIALRSARSFIDWQKRRDFVKDLDLQRTMIVDRVAQTRADLALDLMWRFMDLAEPVINRVDVGLADRVFTALLANAYGVFDDVVPVMLPALGDVGAAHLKGRLAQVLADRSRKVAGRDWQVGAARRALMDIADSQADVDAYIALVPAAERGMPHAGAEIGRRLLAAGRAKEALAALEAARPKQRSSRARHDDDEFHLAEHDGGSGWKEVHIEALEAAGQTEQAQRLRWAAFEERLSSTQLRAYLKRLPDFDDVEAEERAMKYASGFQSFPTALDFFRAWPNQARAAALVLARASEIDGNMYYLLDPDVLPARSGGAAGRRQAPAGRDVAAAGDDRGHAGWGEVQPLQTRRPAPARMRVAGARHPGVGNLRDP